MANFNFENNRLLDVVDENDKVISLKSRDDIHRLGLLHREVHVWIFDENKNIFFQKRGLHRPSAGLLDASIGGHVNNEEDYLNAAIRETKEESGISISPADLILLKKFKKVLTAPKSDSSDKVNNFIRNVYIYKKPVKEKQMKKESGLLGVSFKKLSVNLLLHPTKEDIKMFDKFILTDELPDVLNYLNNLPA